MCEANAYFIKNGDEELFMESVDVVEPQEDKLFIKNIFGEQKTVSAHIKQIRLLEHKIILEK